MYIAVIIFTGQSVFARFITCFGFSAKLNGTNVNLSPEQIGAKCEIQKLKFLNRNTIFDITVRDMINLPSRVQVIAGTCS